MRRTLQSGLTLVEVLIATSIILAFVLAFLSVYNIYLRTALSNSSSVKAAFLLEESLEAVRFLRDSSWDANIATLTPTVEYDFIFNAGSWSATTTKSLIDGVFEREVVFSEVYRNASADIVEGGGTLDPGTLKVTASISWRKGHATSTKSISTYIADIFDE